MEIKFSIKNRNFSISIGHETAWFSQIYFIILAEEWYQNRKFEYARVLWYIK